jgi:predicted LPLAT superfamily acyltransferase
MFARRRQVLRWIGFLADRVVSKGRNETVDFLGAPSQFPVGPAAIAGMFKVPLISVFPLYINGGYEVYCDVISESAEVPRSTRQEALRAYVVDYVAQLEKYVVLAPYNWFNFFDYWDAE